MTRLNVMQPWLGDEEVAAIAEVVSSGWIAQGPRVAAFESAFALMQEAHHAVAVSSCTTALHLSLLVAGVGRGDDVIVPSFSFIATANAPTYVGALPVFADVDPLTGNLTAATVERVLTDRTQAVIAVDQGGVPVDLDELRSLCDPRGIVVIEDAACGAGSTYRDRPVGAGAEIVTWSFHPRKIVTTGEGGMITTTHADWAARARRLREHSMSVSASDRHGSVLAPAEDCSEVGFNYRMTDLQAAIGVVQLDKLPAMVARRRQIADVYLKYVEDVDGLRAVNDPPWGTTNFQSFWIEVSPPYPLDRDGLLAHLASHDISARRGIMSLHRQSAYAHCTDPDQVESLAVSDHLSDTTLILPLFHEMSVSEQVRVIDALMTGGRKDPWTT